MAGLWRERELRVRLAELHRYRLAGVTRLEECAHYEQHAAQRKHPHALDVRTRPSYALAPANRLFHFWVRFRVIMFAFFFKLARVYGRAMYLDSRGRLTNWQVTLYLVIFFFNSVKDD